MPAVPKEDNIDMDQILSNIKSKKKRYRPKKRNRPKNLLSKRVDKEMELSGSDLEIFRERFTALKSRSLLVKFDKSKIDSEEIFSSAKYVKMGWGGFFTLIFKSQKKALKEMKKLKKNPDVEVKYDGDQQIGNMLVVDPLVLSVDNLPDDATKEDLKQAFPNALKIALSQKRKTSLLYGKKEHAAEDFRREDIEVNGSNLILLYRIIYDKSDFKSAEAVEEDSEEED